MNIQSNNNTLSISAIQELTAANAISAKSTIKDALSPDHMQIDIDLSTTSFVDSSGLGVLISLHKEMASRKGQLRILNPTKSTEQILELTRLHRLFEVVKQ